MASDFVKIESMLDANPDPDLGPCLENNEDGNDFFNDLDSTGWENYENQLDREKETAPCDKLCKSQKGSCLFHQVTIHLIKKCQLSNQLSHLHGSYLLVVNYYEKFGVQGL